MARIRRMIENVVIVTGGAVGIGNGAAGVFAREERSVIIAVLGTDKASLAANNAIPDGGLLTPLTASFRLLPHLRTRLHSQLAKLPEPRALLWGCGGATSFDCAGNVCGDFGCIDPGRDNLNRGNCANTCSAPQVCTNGVCGGAPDDTPCAVDSECCSHVCYGSIGKTCSNIMGSGGADYPQAPMTFWGPGVCSELRRDIDHCGACFNACPRTSGGIVCAYGACHGINSAPNPQ